MATTINKVRELASREHLAEGIRNRAEASWRIAWWDTTLALAAVESVPGGDGAVGEALAAAADVLGQSRRWMGARRFTGLRVDLALTLKEQSKIKTVPPRLAVEYARSNQVIDEAAVDALLAAERDGVSIRDLAREQGTQPTSWQREGERTVPEPTPERRQEIAREEIARDPGIVKGVLAGNRDLEREVVQDANVRGVQRMRDAGIRPNEELDAEEQPFASAVSATALMQGVQRNLRAAIIAVRDVRLEPEDQALLLSYRDTTERLLTAFGQSLTGDIDAELARLLNEDSP